MGISGFLLPAILATAASLILLGLLAVAVIAHAIWTLLDRFGPHGETWTVTYRETA